MKAKHLKIALGASLIGLTSIPAFAADELEKLIQDDNQWVTQRKDYASTGYSKLSQISQSNVKNLKAAWTFATGVNRGHEGAPLVIGDTMYFTTAFPNNVYALDLNNEEKIKWSYFPKQDPSVQALLCCDNVTRGLAYGDGKIFLQQNDGQLVALDAKTGAKIWDVGVVDVKQGATTTNAPHVFKDKVITGCSGGEYGVRCYLTAYNIKDGSIAWRAYSTGPDSEVLIGKDFNKDNPHYSSLSVYEDVNGGNKEGGSFKALPKEKLKFPEKDLGVKTWLKPQATKNGWEQGGGATWGWYSYDSALNLVYYSTGNPSVWNPDVRPGDNKWSMTIFARDLDTGVAKWGYQLTPHDEWDFDAVNETILWDADGKKLATHFDRNGFGYTLDRQTGKLLVAEKMHPFVNWATGIDLVTGIPQKDPKFSTHEDVNVTGICPAALGVKDQQPAAYSPKTKLFYVPLNHVCMDYEPVEVKYVAGQPWVGATLSMYPGPDGVMGGFMAWDGLKGKQAWYKKEKFSVWSGALATASDVVFYGTLDRWFKAVDAKSGKELWKFRVGSGVVGNPITYGHKGKQYVAILSGIGGWAGVAMNLGLTNDNEGLGAAGGYKELKEWNAAPGGGALNVFSL
ncbi:methanol/ethanol family PQQ-dependent dehydrogenase [Methylobacillus flagellatus]|uniref:methanol/ethanol family PQQ-dependent dehydrogenase n=1 Tax=Methylobacillus flagellatus TaxID=405 RepID=UPI002853B63B|nr:methanol/ethanol family PQQ-dependent dehydrogenase [Methylobacillus flagellatus]MDR5170358.1 methanol/ethanol family PQQ-dependent dehydrogenase [Methylobacillus flagellatus]